MNWIKYGKEWEEFEREELNKAGTLVKSEDKVYLIGDINELSGVCDCCKQLRYEIVDEYCVVWEGEK